MKVAIIAVILAILTSPLMASDPKGTVPRSSARTYAAHAQADGASIGATRLTSKEVHQAFSSNLNSCCLVVEVALYPAKGKPIDVSLDDFALQLGSGDTAIKPSSARLLAAELQKNNQQPATGVTVSPQVNVGYESGIDPITGQRVHGIEYGAAVGVGVGPQQTVAPASTGRDRDVMELELKEKGLPEEIAPAPVAGYLYFTLSKEGRKAAHQLEYILNGQKMLLKLN